MFIFILLQLYLGVFSCAVAKSLRIRQNGGTAVAFLEILTHPSSGLLGFFVVLSLFLIYCISLYNFEFMLLVLCL